jgi:EAL domain-containing protein (putative c-di-GMP-specific phosphodiesterase class I)
MLPWGGFRSAFPIQANDANLLTDVETALESSGLPPAALELEITENIALVHDEDKLAGLQTLKARGVGLAFDGLGTGYASLSYLTRFPLTQIKIDQSFVRRITDASTIEGTAIVRSMIIMAHNLRLEVVAEGVETARKQPFYGRKTATRCKASFLRKPCQFENLRSYCG